MERLRKQLMNEYATKCNNPVHTVNDLTTPLKVCVCSSDEIVEDMVNEHLEKAILDGANLTFIRQLKNRLCDFAGDELVFDLDEYADLIFEKGQLWHYPDYYLSEMKIGRCHQNACWLLNHYDGPEGVHLAVGYALHSHGFWFAHTWLVTKNETGQPVIWETCCPCELYYGVILMPKEVNDFRLKYDYQKEV